MVFSLEHDIKVTKNHQNLLPTQSVLVAHTVVLCVGTHYTDYRSWIIKFQQGFSELHLLTEHALNWLRQIKNI
jgi:hypothetical protein